MKVNGKPALEYDGLRTGELAWVLGRRFKTVADGSPGTDILDLDETQRYSHQAYAGLGTGVDRMQRLASTDWVESLVQTCLLYTSPSPRDATLSRMPSSA